MNWRWPRLVSGALIGALWLAAGAARAAQPGELAKGYLLHLPGIGGKMRIDRNMTSGLKDALPDVHLEIYDWTCGDPGLDALLAQPRNKAQARIVAQKLTEEYRAHPELPIFLTAHSGGVGIAVWAMEDLPKDVKIDTVIFLAGALSPEYDLSTALEHVTHKAFNVSSMGDLAVLGIGTRTFGTIDGVKTDAAGRVGFTEPTVPADPAQYKKLVEMRYDDRWMELGNIGDHIGPMSRSFARVMLAPLILHEAPPDLPPLRPTTEPAAAGVNQATTIQPQAPTTQRAGQGG